MFILEAAFLRQSSLNLVEMCILVKSNATLKVGHMWSESGLPAEILKKNLVYTLEASWVTCGQCTLVSDLGPSWPSYI